MAKLAEDAGDQGIEADNNSQVNDAQPRANPTLANMSFIGHKDADIGLLLREGTSASISNSVFTGFGDACLTLDQEETFKHSRGMDPTGIQISNTVLNCETQFEVIDPAEAMFTPECTAEDIFKRDSANQTVDPQLDNYTLNLVRLF